MTERIVGLGVDGSLTATGLVALPSDWRGDWSKVARMTIGQDLDNAATVEEKVRRIDLICTAMMGFAEDHECTHAWITGYAFNKQRSRVYSLGELGGNLRRDIVLGLHLPLVEVNDSSTRTLIGKFSGKDQKKQAHKILREAGLPRNWTEDEIDAWLAVNWKFSAMPGADAIILREAA